MNLRTMKQKLARALLGCAVLGTLAAAAATPSVTITKAQQRYPWNDKIDIDYAITCDTTRHYGLRFLLIDGAVTNSVDTDVIIKPSDNITSKSGRYTIDVPTRAPDFDKKLRAGGIKIVAILSDNGVLDSGDGVTFVPGDYLSLNLTTGEVTPLLNVQNATQYNNDSKYKTTHMIFRRIPAGSFKMQAKDSTNLANTSGTQVTIPTDYYIAVYPCTQKQWSTIAGSVPSSQTATGDTIPVARVSWNMIAGTTSPKYITTLNSKMSASGYKVALPNEAQWERAARAGTTTEWFFGAASTAIGTYAWYTSNASSQTHAVGGKSPNAWGLYDMYGNVLEWCSDWYASSITYSQQPGGPSSGSYRVRRGGSYGHDASYCSSVNRYGNDPSSTYYYGGFRLIMTLK